MKLVWSQEARDALGVLEASLAQRYSAQKAVEIVEALVRRVEHLEDHPQLGRAVPEYGRLLPESIEIVTIVPARIPLPESDS